MTQELQDRCTRVWRCDNCSALAARDDGKGFAYSDHDALTWLREHLRRSPDCGPKPVHESGCYTRRGGDETYCDCNIKEAGK